MPVTKSTVNVANMTHVFSGTMPVDAGMIGVIKKSYLETFGDLRDNDYYHSMEIPAGKIRLTVKGCWKGSPSAEFVSDGSEYVIGDPCYPVSDKCGVWEKFLGDTDYCEKLPPDVGVVISTGGDGEFFIEVEHSNENS
jgi:hypothetical protein